jgi:hypothetical protein
MWRLALVSVILTGAAFPVERSTECDVATVYSSLDTPLGTAALTDLGDIQEVELILVPASLDPGAYSISVTRKGSNIYRVDGKDLFVTTRYCYEYAYSEDAILKYEGHSGFTRGELIFPD